MQKQMIDPILLMILTCILANKNLNDTNMKRFVEKIDQTDQLITFHTKKSEELKNFRKNYFGTRNISRELDNSEKDYVPDPNSKNILHLIMKKSVINVV